MRLTVKFNQHNDNKLQRSYIMQQTNIITQHNLNHDITFNIINDLITTTMAYKYNTRSNTQSKTSERNKVYPPMVYAYMYVK